MEIERAHTNKWTSQLLLSFPCVSLVLGMSKLSFTLTNLLPPNASWVCAGPSLYSNPFLGILGVPHLYPIWSFPHIFPCCSPPLYGHPSSFYWACLCREISLLLVFPQPPDNPWEETSLFPGKWESWSFLFTWGLISFSGWWGCILESLFECCSFLVNQV